MRTIAPYFQARKARFAFHPERCVGCYACVTACLNEHNIDLAHQKPVREVKRTERRTDETLRITWYSLACHHCADASCMRACPNDCFSRDAETGTVQLNSTTCSSCRSCSKACPFHAIRYCEDQPSTKCSGCHERLKQGLLPACVSACPREALTVDERPSVIERARSDILSAIKQGGFQ